MPMSVSINKYEPIHHGLKPDLQETENVKREGKILESQNKCEIFSGFLFCLSADRPGGQWNKIGQGNFDLLNLKQCFKLLSFVGFIKSPSHKGAQ